MDPELSLLIAGLIARFLVCSTLAFCICLILNKLATKASLRFLVWAGFLYGSAAYWIYLASTLVLHSSPVAGKLVAPSQTPPVTPQSWAAFLHGFWSVPHAWAFPLSVVFAALAAGYGLVILWVTASHINKLRRLRWVMGFATEAPSDIAEMFQSLAKNLAIRSPRLLMLSGTFSPATFGWFRPVVMLPALCVEEEGSDLKDILLHELHHVRRQDAFWNALGIAARTLLCFHPAAWYAMAQMRVERELACDLAVVLHSPARRSVYAESLLRFARMNVATEPANWGIDFAAPASHLTVRVHSILTEARRVSPWLLGLRTATGLALLAVLVGVAPSLAILLVYTDQPTQVTAPSFATTQTPAHKEVRQSRRVRGRASQDTTETEGVASVSNPDVSAPPVDASAAANEQHPVPDTGPGPHLQRRTATTTAAARSQSIPLIDDGDSGQSGKHGEAGQAVQQTATIAAAVWKRAGDLDRR